MKKEKNLIVLLENYLAELSAVLHSDETRDRMIKQIISAKTVEKAKGFYLLYHSHPTWTFFSVKAGTLLDKVVATQRILDEFNTEYPDPPELLRLGIQRRRDPK